MFLKKVLFLHLAVFQTVVSSENDGFKSTSNFENVIGGKLETILKNQNEMKNHIDELKKEILTLKEDNNVCKKSLETKIDTKTYLEDINNKLAKLTQPKSCRDVQKSGKTLSEVYTIWPENTSKSFDVWCDMETRGGGWIYVVNKFDGSVDFNLNWTDYKNGFGNLNGEFWLGLEHLYLLTKNKPKELLIELVQPDSKKVHIHYKKFSIGDESEGYPIKIIEEYNGNLTDNFRYHAGSKFSTVDRDQDESDQNCAEEYGGGFWYGDCFYLLFTGSIMIKVYLGDYYFKGVRMMIK